MAWRSPPMPRNPIEDLHWRVGLLEENVLPLGFDEAVFIFDKIRHSSDVVRSSVTPSCGTGVHLSAGPGG